MLEPAMDEVRVDEVIAIVEEDRMLEEDLVDKVPILEEEEEVVMPQVPNWELQPVLQWAESDPHHPEDEQQFPKMLP